jgi:hypothetical protein
MEMNYKVFFKAIFATEKCCFLFIIRGYIASDIDKSEEVFSVTVKAIFLKAIQILNALIILKWHFEDS